MLVPSRPPAAYVDLKIKRTMIVCRIYLQEFKGNFLLPKNGRDVLFLLSSTGFLMVVSLPYLGMLQSCYDHIVGIG
jgi:hypothetical protein